MTGQQEKAFPEKTGFLSLVFWASEIWRYTTIPGLEDSKDSRSWLCALY
jgi:hypothetical protein